MGLSGVIDDDKNIVAGPTAPVSLPEASNATIVSRTLPVRPQPVCTSSAIKSTLYFLHRAWAFAI